MSPRALLATLLALDAVCWGVLLWGIAHGHLDVPALVYAIMFAAMATAVPIVAAWPQAAGSAMPSLCRECGALQGADDVEAGFCLHCGVFEPAPRGPPGSHA